MIFVILNGKKVEPSPNTSALCPLCSEKVISKCGEIKVWHWAHAKGKSCDSWHEPETTWHKNWKMTFGKDNSEVVIKIEDKRHIADVLTKENVVIELQNSPIQKKIISQRETFYGEKMIWISNGLKFKDKFFIKDLDSESHSWSTSHNTCKDKEGRKVFTWEYHRRSWEDTKRYVFIDFGEDALFWVLEGIGQSCGEGKLVSKKDFILKYGGDYLKHLRLFRNLTIELNLKNLRLRGVDDNLENIHLTTSITYKGNRRTLETHFENKDDTLKIKRLRKIIVNDILDYEERNQNLRLVNSRFIEGLG